MLVRVPIKRLGSWVSEPAFTLNRREQPTLPLPSPDAASLPEASTRTRTMKRKRLADAHAETGESQRWLGLLVALGLIELADALPLAHELDRISAMLTRLIRPAKPR